MISVLAFKLQQVGEGDLNLEPGSAIKPQGSWPYNYDLVSSKL